MISAEVGGRRERLRIKGTEMFMSRDTNLKAVASLRLLPNHIQNRVHQLSSCNREYIFTIREYIFTMREYIVTLREYIVTLREYIVTMKEYIVIPFGSTLIE